VNLIGLTGGIASGKSTVAAILRRLGAAIVNADELSREVVQPDKEAWREIVNAFGAEVLQSDRTIDRQKLRKIIFSDPEARKKLEAIIHPRVRALAKERCQEHAAAGFEIVVYEVPLLFEGNLQDSLRPVVLVATDVATQKKRLKDRDHLTESEAAKHIAAQMSLDEKRRLADFVIENDGSLEDLERRVREVLAKIKDSADKP
jgi:dephospho-CoA kinase